MFTVILLKCKVIEEDIYVASKAHNSWWEEEKEATSMVELIYNDS